MSADAPSYPLLRERNLILAVLLVLAAVAWATLIWQSDEVNGQQMAAAGESQPMAEGSSMDEDAMAPGGEMERSAHMGLSMDMSALLFLGLWAAMMVAIMFPTAAPMILTFARVQTSRKSSGSPFVPTWLFVASYIVLWCVTGLAAYAVASGGDALARDWDWLMDNAARIGGGVLVVAGVYQFTPLKRLCLTKCRTPISFILGSWRDGNAGAVRMGLEHGAYCFGCCWMLFVILFPLGMMNIAAMAVVTALIFAEKSFRHGERIAQAAAVLLIFYGAFVIAVPSSLPISL